MLTRRRFLQSAALASAALAAPTAVSARVATPRTSRRPDSPSAPLLDPATQPRFVNPLPNPLAPSYAFDPVVAGDADRYQIGARQISQRLGLVGAGGQALWTTVWGYGTSTQEATYPGRTIHARRDRRVEVRWSNELIHQGTPVPHLLPVDPTVHWALGDDGAVMMGGTPGRYEGAVPIVTHLHGGHSRSDSDGLPDAWFTPGYERTGRLFREWYTYDNDQEAATLWYHDHALGITRLNVYAGLAGFYILRDDTEQALIDANAIPSGPYEVAAVIQDRMFRADGQLHYPAMPEHPDHPDPSVLPEFFGDVILVNGQAWPRLDVEPRPYRIRLLNGSDSRFYTLFLSTGAPFMQIGTDAGLLPGPVDLDQLTIGPGERADVVIDFSRDAGRTVVVRNGAHSPFPKGAPPARSVREIMAFRVSLSLSSKPKSVLPIAVRSPIAALTETAPRRQLLLFEGVDEFGRLKPMLGTTRDGALAWHEPITEDVRLGDTEVWEIFNATEDAHPIHLHLVSFQILGRQRFRADMDGETGALDDIRLIGAQKPADPNERGWKDTARMLPGEVTRVIARFDREGEYVWHCHILSHEDHEMMRPYVVSA